MRRILVTGYNGFIGSHLVSFLQSKNCHIIGVCQNYHKEIKIQQIKKNIQQIKARDIRDNISDIIHLAALTDLNFCQKNPIECFKTNVLGTQNLLEISRKKNCNFIYVSTSHVYGKPTKLPIDEKHPRNATSIYAASKICGELTCESYSKSYNMNVTILRLFSVYGPNSSPHLVISRIISQLFHSNSVKLGNLSPKRDFIYVDDAVRAIEHVICSRGLNIYNVGSGKSHSVSEVCTILKKLTGRNLSIISTKKYSRKNEIENIVSNSSKLKKCGWKSKINLTHGLQLTVDSYQS